MTDFKNFEWSDLLIGVMYFTKRMNKDLPEFNDWSSNDLREYLKDLEIEFIQRLS